MTESERLDHWAAIVSDAWELHYVEVPQPYRRKPAREQEVWREQAEALLRALGFSGVPAPGAVQAAVEALRWSKAHSNLSLKAKCVDDALRALGEEVPDPHEGRA